MGGRAAAAIACGGAACVALLAVAGVRAGAGAALVGSQSSAPSSSVAAAARSVTAPEGGLPPGGAETADRPWQGAADDGLPGGLPAEAGSQGRGAAPGSRLQAFAGMPVRARPAVAEPDGPASGPVAAASGGGAAGDAQGPRSAPYEPIPVIQAVRSEPGAGVRISHAVDVGFAFRPDHYRNGAMRVANESGRPLAISFHGGDCTGLRLNGQPVVEGRSYLVSGDAEIAGSSPVGVHVRPPAAPDREAAPTGVG